MKKLRNTLPFLIVVAGFMIFSGCGPEPNEPTQKVGPETFTPAPTTGGMYGEVTQRINEGACSGSKVAYSVPVSDEYSAEDDESQGVMVTCRNGTTEWWENP